MQPITIDQTGVTNFILRAYRESQNDQYIRELYQNAIEGCASIIEFSPEWQAVERLGVWRLMIADNGAGMLPQQMEMYLSHFGKSGKSSGGLHDNFGIGSRSSTLPWNPDGVVILSYTEDYPSGAMVWLRYDSESGCYGMRELSDDGDTVVEPFDDSQGPSRIDWSMIAPDWVRNNTGTVVVLLGGNETLNTFWGKRGEDPVRNIRSYLNTRYWEIPENVAVYVSESRVGRSKLPLSRVECFARRDDSSRAFDTCAVKGARSFASLNPKDRGTVKLADGTEVHWFLKHTGSTSDTDGPRKGFVAALYKNELYSYSNKAQTMRAWGVPQKDLAERLTLVVEPVLATEGDGVFPSQARATLCMRRDGNSTELPWEQWREEFRDKLPEAIILEMSETEDPEESSDARLEEIDRLIRERYEAGTVAKLKADPDGDEQVEPNRGEGPQEPANPPKPRPPRPRHVNIGPPGNGVPALVVPGGGSALPKFEWEIAENLDEEAAKHGAVWCEPNAKYPSGLIQGNRDFPPLRLLIEAMQRQWQPAFAARIEKAVLDEIRVAMIARVAEFRSRLPQDFGWKSRVVRDALSDPVLFSFAMVGLISEQDVIKRQLTEMLGKPKKREIKAA